MSKPPEEGEIWEWRAFGRVGARLDAEVRSHPIRMDVADASGEDIYLVSPDSNQNVKLRNWSGHWVLKFKLLLLTGPRSAELYSESGALAFRFPVASKRLKEAATLLGVRLPQALSLPHRLSDRDFLEALAASSPPARSVLVSKVRSQFAFEGGWVELADVVFPRGRVQSLSIHSRDLTAVEKMLDHLRPDPELEAMNYVEACRRWGLDG